MLHMIDWHPHMKAVRSSTQRAGSDLWQAQRWHLEEGDRREPIKFRCAAMLTDSGDAAVSGQHNDGTRFAQLSGLS
jgi:hypothetical protein